MSARYSKAEAAGQRCMMFDALPKMSRAYALTHVVPAPSYAEAMAVKVESVVPVQAVKPGVRLVGVPKSSGVSFKELLAMAESEARMAGMDEDDRLGPEGERGLDCGFAWVTVKPARGPFVNWCKAEAAIHGQAGKRRFGSKAHDGGWQFWKPGDMATQSVDVHIAAAKAFCAVLVANGLDASVGSRLD